MSAVDIKDLHRRVAIADCHADSLMWNRDLTVKNDTGHVDFPRLREAGVKIQCFTVVTRGLPVIDGFSPFTVTRGWPKEARSTEWTRCSFQLDQLDQFCRAAPNDVAVATSATSLEQNLKDGKLSAVVGIEGAHAIEGKVERVRELYHRGVRFMSITHLTNNELGGTSTAMYGNKPLTPLGHEVVREMAHCGMVIDLAHASEAMLDELLSIANVRVFTSHTGVKGVTNLWRNLSDDHLKRIAQRGGVAAIIFARQYVGGPTFDDVAKHIEHAISIMGEDGVALGSDFDGMIPLPKGMNDVRDLPRLTETLVRRKLPVRVLEKVLGENVRRFFSETLGRS